MANWREIWPGHHGIVTYPLKDTNGDPFAALIPISDCNISGVSPDTDYWCGAHPDTWPKQFTFIKESRPTPTSATEATSYGSGTNALTKWHARALQEFVGTVQSYAWTAGRCWKAVVPELRTTTDHYIYIAWTGADFEWFVTTKDTASYIEVPTAGFEFNETGLSLIGVKATDI